VARPPNPSRDAADVGEDAEQSRVVDLLDNLPTAVLLFRAGTLEHANPAARQLLDLDGTDGGAPLEVLGSAALADAVA
jgi:hypothetical protein